MKIIVIGLGSMGKRRIRLIRSIYPEYTLMGIDSNHERMEAVEKEYQITCYESIEEAKEKENIECAFICTSPLSHANIITKCLQNDWNVFTEINLVSDEYENNIKLAEEKNKLLFLSSTPIYRAEMKKIREEVTKSEKPVTYLYHVGQYLPDWHPWENFNQFFVGNKRTNGCREIFAIELPWMIQTFGAIKSVQVIKRKISDLPIEYCDDYLVQIQHDNGTCGTFHVDVVSRQATRHLEVYNEELFIQWDGTPETLKHKNLGNKGFEILDCRSEYQHEEGYSKFIDESAYVSEIREFFYVLEKKADMQYGFKEDSITLQIIDEIEG